MNEINGQNLPPELTRIEERLREERTTASGLELDQLKLRALRQSRQAKPGTQPKGQWMKSRLVLVTMIVAGLMMSMTGATLAISGSSGDGNAAQRAYEDDTVAGQDQGGGGADDTVGGNEVAGQDNGAGSTPEDAQEVQQAAASGDGDGTLPFTGLLAVPLMIGGVALLGTGAMLRRKSRD